MKADFLKHLDSNCIIKLEGDTKKAVLEEIIALATTRCTLDESQLRKLIWEREKMLTTGIGHGLALPHVRVDDFPNPVVIIGVCAHPVTDYKSIDSEPIRLLVFVAANARDQEAYLKLLGSVSHKFKEAGMLEKVIGNINDPEKILDILGKE